MNFSAMRMDCPGTKTNLQQFDTRTQRTVSAPTKLTHMTKESQMDAERNIQNGFETQKHYEEAMMEELAML